MLLYTPIPNELIMKNEIGDEVYLVQEMEYDGIMMQVQHFQYNQYKVVRILSTNPKDFLRNDIQPGMIINC